MRSIEAAAHSELLGAAEYGRQFQDGSRPVGRVDIAALQNPARGVIEFHKPGPTVKPPFAQRQIARSNHHPKDRLR